MDGGYFQVPSSLCNGRQQDSKILLELAAWSVWVLLMSLHVYRHLIFFTEWFWHAWLWACLSFWVISGHEHVTCPSQIQLYSDSKRKSVIFSSLQDKRVRANVWINILMAKNQCKLCIKNVVLLRDSVSHTTEELSEFLICSKCC